MSKQFLVNVPYQEMVYGTVSFVVEAETAEDAVEKFLDADDMDVHLIETNYGDHYEEFREEAEAEEITNENFTSV